MAVATLPLASPPMLSGPILHPLNTYTGFASSAQAMNAPMEHRDTLIGRCVTFMRFCLRTKQKTFCVVQLSFFVNIEHCFLCFKLSFKTRTPLFGMYCYLKISSVILHFAKNIVHGAYVCIYIYVMHVMIND